MINQTKKIIGIVVLAAIIVTVAVIFRQFGSGPVHKDLSVNKDGAIKIGVILPMTGKAGSFGKYVQDALDIAMDEIGLVLAQNSVRKIELIYQDSECDPKKAVSAYRFMHDVNDIKVFIGDVCSNCTLAIAPLAEKDKAILITPASSAMTISEAGDFVFRNHTSDKAEMELLAPYVVEKYKKIVMLYDSSNDSMVIQKEIFAHILTWLGGRIVADMPIVAGKGDYKTELVMLRPMLDELDAVFVLGFAGDAVIITEQLDQLKIKKPIIGVKTFGTPEYVDNVSRELSHGIIYAEAAYDENTNPDFWDKYLNKAGKAPTVWSAQGYDTLKILAMILETCSPDDTVCIRDELYKVKDYPGVAGKTTFDGNGDVIKEIAIKQIQKGKFVRVR